MEIGVAVGTMRVTAGDVVGRACELMIMLSVCVLPFPIPMPVKSKHMSMRNSDVNVAVAILVFVLNVLNLSFIVWSCQY